MKIQLTLAILFVFLISSLNLIIIAEDSDYQTEKQDLLNTSPYLIQKIVHEKDQKFSDFYQERNISDISFINFEEDILISEDNPNGDDSHPKIIRKDNILVLTYEKSINSSSKTNPIVWSKNYGQTWTTQFEIDSSTIFSDYDIFSGIMHRPDIKYVPGIDQFYFSAVDPEALMYNNVMLWIPGNIITAEEALVYVDSGPPNYYDSATGATENWGIAVTTVDAYDMDKTFGLGYYTYPDFEKPSVMGGYYYDGNSFHNSYPADKLEMEMNENRIFLVSEQIEKGKISIKSTVNDEALLTNGEMLNGMDKYADIEQWPGEYIANGSNPDISACEDKVFVVYVENDTIKCKYSTSSDSYDPHFDWNESIIDKYNVYCPTVYAYSTNKIICAYVKDNNLFVAKSYDGALTWEEPYQINDIDGVVVETSGSVSINDVGVVWTDNREEQSDIYFQLNNVDFFIPLITFTGGLGITIEIENIGNISVENIDISIIIDAPFIFIGQEISINLSIDKYDSVTYRMFTFGFGKMTITVDCGMFGSESASGFLCGPLVWIN